MAEVIRMPRMSDTMEEGVIVGWLKNEGDDIEPGDLLAEVETDKATMELESYWEGKLLHIAIKEGPVPVDAVVAVVGEEGEDYQSLLDEAAQEESETKEKEEDEKEQEEKPADKEDSAKPETTAQKSSDDDGRTKASPLARKMASDKGIDISQLSGSGDGGRIIKRDVEKAIESGVQAPAAASAAGISIQSGEDQTVRLSQMRKIIGKRLSESK